MPISDYNVLDDGKLVVLLQQDDKHAFSEVYRRYWKPLFDSAHKQTRDTQVCEEIVQEIFIKLWEKRLSLALTTGLGNYLYTAVKYKVFDHYRAVVVRENFRAMVRPEADHDNSTIEQILLNDLINHITVLVGQLPAKCKSVYRLSRVEHKSNKEIAYLLDISEKTVEGHLTKALGKLKLHLQTNTMYIIILLDITLNKKI